MITRLIAGSKNGGGVERGIKEEGLWGHTLIQVTQQNFKGHEDKNFARASATFLSGCCFRLVLPAPQLDLEVYCCVLEVLLRPLEESELRSCSDVGGEFRRRWVSMSANRNSRFRVLFAYFVASFFVVQ